MGGKVGAFESSGGVWLLSIEITFGCIWEHAVQTTCTQASRESLDERHLVRALFM